jgi:hypothetical protein
MLYNFRTNLEVILDYKLRRVERLTLRRNLTGWRPSLGENMNIYGLRDKSLLNGFDLQGGKRNKLGLCQGKMLTLGVTLGGAIMRYIEWGQDRIATYDLAGGTRPFEDQVLEAMKIALEEQTPPKEAIDRVRREEGKKMLAMYYQRKEVLEKLRSLIPEDFNPAEKALALCFLGESRAGAVITTWNEWPKESYPDFTSVCPPE